MEGSKAIESAKVGREKATAANDSKPPFSICCFIMGRQGSDILLGYTVLGGYAPTVSPENASILWESTCFSDAKKQNSTANLTHSRKKYKRLVGKHSCFLYQRAILYQIVRFFHAQHQVQISEMSTKLLTMA